MRADEAQAGVPASMVEHEQRDSDSSGRLRSSPSSGASSASGNAGREPVGEALDARRPARAAAARWPARRARRPRSRRGTCGRAESRLASSSATHRTPGAMRASRLRSGPMPSGMMATTTRIEAERDADGAALAPGESEVAADQRRRALITARGSAERELCANWQLERRMAWRRRRCRRRARCSRDQPPSSLCEARVERDRRLVEQPDRARREKQAGEREPPLLPGREIGRPADRAARPRPNAASASSRSIAAAAEKSAQKASVLATRQRRLQALSMADIVALLADAGSASPPSSANRAGGERQAGRRSCAAGWSCRRRSGPSAAAPRRPRARTTSRRRAACRRARQASPRRRAASRWHSRGIAQVGSEQEHWRAMRCSAHGLAATNSYIDAGAAFDSRMRRVRRGRRSAASASALHAPACRAAQPSAHFAGDR